MNETTSRAVVVLKNLETQLTIFVSQFLYELWKKRRNERNKGASSSLPRVLFREKPQWCRGPGLCPRRKVMSPQPPFFIPERLACVCHAHIERACKGKRRTCQKPLTASTTIARAGISEKKAFAVIETARSSIGVSFIRADEPLKMSQHVLRLTSGSKVVDRLLDGGLETQTITEFYGEYGTGKSQICHQLCVNVQLPPERGGLSGATLYIDTENTFRTERIVQMSRHLRLDPAQVVKNIIYAEALLAQSQES